uniref:otoancorin n=1 Tax=Scatophagus argus TaxID=75038 RepID=UPI001ED84F89|nr:otoancorin [Scatophagus argus]XP_046256839.1 otoancorin [Scatophagus argus]XP_046256840.1 otoancorin [Scatophagus argus]
MVPKRETLFLLLTVACAALAMDLNEMPENRPVFKNMAKRLMRKCQEKGYPVPEMPHLKMVFNYSDLPMVGRNSDQPNTVLSTFMNILSSVSHIKDPLNRIPSDNEMANMNCSYLPSMIKQMRNSSEASVCYMRAFVGSMFWSTLTTQSDNNMDSDDYDTLLWAAKPVLRDMPLTRMGLPMKLAHERVKNMMKMLQEMYKPLSEDKRDQVVRWAKQQIAQNYFNCTMMPSSDSGLKMEMRSCKSSLKWLNSETMKMMGPYLCHLTPNDVDCSPQEKLCEFFRSAQFKSALRMATKMNPSLASKFLQRFRECFSGDEEFAQHVDKLGILACYYYPAPDLTSELGTKLLSELDDCDNPRIKMLKMHLVKSAMSDSNTTQTLRELGSSVSLLSPRQLSMISWNDLKEIYKNATVQWTQSQMRTLVKKHLGNTTCKEVSCEELMDLQSVAGGLPNCVLKHVKVRELLNDTEALMNISKLMKKGQLKAMLHGLREDVHPSELVEKLQGALLRRLSLSVLAKASITSLDQVENKIWRLSQAAYLAKKMQNLNQLQYRRLHSILQGITCKMIDKVAASDVQDMTQAIWETPQWLSKVQAGCAARKLFATLETERTDYFKTITEEEMDQIPTALLLHLPPSKVMDLPDSVCPVFLDKMEVANLSSLPLRAPSRPFLTQRALLCLGTNLSRLSTEDVSRLGPLLCELQPSQLRLVASSVLNSTLQAMASCQHIPQHHRANLIQLVNDTFGDPSDWSAETMEKLGPLLLLDDNATSALPNKPWMKDVLFFLWSRLSQASDTLKKKVFILTTTTSTAARSNTGTDSSTANAQVPTVELIEELGMNNVYWRAEQLDQMSVETFTATVETLGKISDYSADQLAVLRKKATEAFGPVSNMTESEVMQMGCITQGLSNTDLEQLPLSLDTLEEIARCGWSESQMEPVWKAVAKYNNVTAQQLGVVEMVALNRFICGLNSREIGQLNMDAFKEAVDSMDGVQCSISVTQQLKRLAVSAFGHPSTWTEAEVSDLGNIIAGLGAAELASLDPSVFSFISKSCVPRIPPSNLAALSAAHLEALGPDNAAMVTSEQQAALRDVQLAALERAATGSRAQQTQSPGESGAPSLSVEGISAFVKPLLFLFTGFLLL